MTLDVTYIKLWPAGCFGRGAVAVLLISVPDFGDHSFARLWCEVRQADVLVR